MSNLFGTDGGKSGWTAYFILWVRVAFGVHALLSGINYFYPLVPPPPVNLSPAGPFVAEMDAVGLYALIKVVEVLVGVLLIANVYVPLALVLEMPTTMSIFFLNTFVDSSPRQLYTGPKELIFNLLLILAYWAYFRPLLTARAEYTPLWRGGRTHAGEDPVASSADKGN
jgi:uncharacterized membrane protein YphA (DoxX/SURF4 family)